MAGIVKVEHVSDFQKFPFFGITVGAMSN